MSGCCRVGGAHNASMDKGAITPGVVSALVAEQFPQWADLAVTSIALDGWDNTTFRLGEQMLVRLPSTDCYSAQVDKEHRWLPVLARVLPLAIPEPLAQGLPGCGYPRPWSIYRWLAGEQATYERVGDLRAFAAALGDFLSVLYRVDPSDGPPPGEHNFFRGGPLTVYDRETREAIVALGDEIDGEAASAVWDAGLAAPSRVPAVWFHGDVAPSNLLVVNGWLSAVIDFGCCGVGDPACDLTIAWTFFDEDSREVFRSHLELDDESWARGRGWALWKALLVLAGFLRSNVREMDDGKLRAGWRWDARHVIREVLADHRRFG